MQSTEASAPEESAEPAPTAWRAPKLSRLEWIFMGCVALGALAVGGLGLYASFENVTKHMASKGFENPEIVPIAIDIAIPVFSVSYLLLVRLNMSLGWVRWVSWGLTYVTIHLNVTSTKELDAQIAHAALPGLWIAFTEIVAHGYRVWIGRANGTRTDPIPLINWFLSPIPTALLWRHMKLWEITSYRKALELRKRQLRSRAALRRTYGRSWRRKAPIELWFEYRIGELSAAQVYDVHRHGDDPERLLATQSGASTAVAPGQPSLPAPREDSERNAPPAELLDSSMPSRAELENLDEQTSLPPGTATATIPEGDVPEPMSAPTMSGTRLPAVETLSEREDREDREAQNLSEQNYERTCALVYAAIKKGRPVTPPDIARQHEVVLRTVQRHFKRMEREGLLPEGILSN